LQSCRAVDADQAVNAGNASLTCCQLSTSIHRLALHPAGYCSQLWWWIRGLSAWIAPPFLLGPTLETIKIRTDNDLLQRAALGRSLAKTHQFLAHAQIITKIFALDAGSLRNPYTVGMGDLLNTCSWCPLRTCKLMPCVPGITLHPGNRGEFCKAEIEQVVAGGGPSGVLLGGKGIENHSGHLGMI
jgi:hypothetical protein